MLKVTLKYLKNEGIFGWNYRHLITHPWVIFKEIYYHTKWFIQRGHRGYADCDQWSIDGYLNRWMPKALRNLKSEHGFPVHVYVQMFPEDNYWELNPIHSALAHAKWHEILEQMAQGFEAAKQINEYEFKGPEELNQLQETMNKGLGLFKEHYQSLWD